MKRRWPRCVVLLLSLLLPAPSITASQEAPLASGGTQSLIVVAGRLSIFSPGPYTLTAIEMTIPPGAAALAHNLSNAVLLSVRSGSLIVQSSNLNALDVVRLEMGERLGLRNRHHLLVQNTNTLPAKVVVVSLTAPAATRKLSDVVSKGGQ